MKTRRLLGIFFFALFGILGTAEGAAYRVGESLVGAELRNQQGEPIAFKAGDARFILFDTPGESGPSKSPQDPDWFERNQALIVVNLSEFSGFKRRMAWDRIKAKPFRIWGVEDGQVADRFPRENGRFTIVQLDESGKIVAIKFAAPGDALKKMVESLRR